MTNFYMMIGLSGSGKTRFANLLAYNENLAHFSSDKFREFLYGDETIQGDNQELFDLIAKSTKEALEKGIGVVVDATNLSRKHRMNFLQKLKNVDCKKIAVWIATPHQTCLRNNELRDRNIPEYVIDRQFKSFNFPQLFEGFDEIAIKWNILDELNYDEDVISDFLDNMEQDNPHHTLTVGQHCRLVYGNLLKMFDTGMPYNGMILCSAGLLHDFGKLYTKTFKDAKGNPSETAHFYAHENCSAYVAPFLLKENGYSDSEIVDIAGLIQYHMRPYGLVTEKAKNKFVKMVGQEFYNNLVILNEADRISK